MRQYTIPHTDGKEGHVDLTAPDGYAVGAYCHTHKIGALPDGFSPTDIRNFEELIKSKRRPVFYLMTAPIRQIWIATSMDDFLDDKKGSRQGQLDCSKSKPIDSVNMTIIQPEEFSYPHSYEDE